MFVQCSTSNGRECPCILLYFRDLLMGDGTGAPLFCACRARLASAFRRADFSFFFRAAIAISSNGFGGGFGNGCSAHKQGAG